MEGLCEIDLNFDSDLNCLEDLYTTMDSCLTEGDELNCPSSMLSMASWTFSPISAADESGVTTTSVCDTSVPDNELIVIEAQEVQVHPGSPSTMGVVDTAGQAMLPHQNMKTESPALIKQEQQQQQQQQLDIVDQQQQVQQQQQLQHHMQFLRQQQQLIQQKHHSDLQQSSCHLGQSSAPVVPSSSSAAVAAAGDYPVTNMNSEYYRSNNVTYHQFVNVHNYAGNYSIGVPICRDMYPWQQPTVMSQVQTPASSYIDHGEMLASLSTNSVSEINRCSTPDYLMTLKALNQLESPTRTTSDNTSCLYSDVSTSRDSPVQDSGYNSDLNVSPLIDYQDNIVVRFPRMCDSKQTSTPASRICPSVAEQQMSSVVVEAQKKAVSNLSFLGQTKTVITGSECVQQTSTANGVQKNLMNELKMYEQPESKPFTSMSDFHKTKKSAQQKSSKTSQDSVKRKFDDCGSDDKENNQGINCSKKRRHNQPLSDSATRTLVDWYQQHLDNPYPSKVEKEKLAKAGGITVTQVKSWFANKRNRSNNTRPKKQMQQMEGKLLELCHELARDAYRPQKDNAYYIQQLSGILGQSKY